MWGLSIASKLIWLPVMTTCDHISLVRLTEGEISILEDERMVRLVHELTWNGKPSVQYPSLQFYIGGNAKNIALRALFPQDNLRGRGCHGHNSVASLRLDTSTITTDQPILFGESNHSTAKRAHETSYDCHQTASHFCRWTSNQSLFDILHARLLFLFADVICIFADDFGNVNNVIDRLKIWATIGSASTLPTVRPRVGIWAYCSSYFW